MRLVYQRRSDPILPNAVVARAEFIAELPNHAREIDPVGLATVLLLGFPLGRRTVLRGVDAVAPDAPDGAVDDHWRRTMSAPLAAARGPLEDFVAMAARLHDDRGTPLRTWLVDDGSDPAYAVIKHPRHDEAAIRELAETVVADWLLGHPGFQLRVNGNNLAVLPPGLSKAAAVAHVITELHGCGRASVVIGAADSDTDLDFLELCDIMLLPSRSQLGNSLRRGVGAREVAHG